MRKTSTVLFAAVAAITNLCADTPCQATYGPGTAGSGGLAPQLGCPQAWLGRASWGLDVDQGLGAAPCIVLSSMFPTNQSAFGMTILADPLASLGSYFFVLGGAPGVAGDGEGFMPLSLSGVPAAPSFAGIDFFFQAFVLDPLGPGVGGGLSASNGLRATLTMPRQLFVAAGPNYWMIDPGSPTATVIPAPVSAIIGIAYDNAGLDVYGTNSFGNLVHGDLRGAQPSWATINSSLGTSVAAWGNLAIQRLTSWGWIGGRGTGSDMEMLVVDLDRGSGTYGQTLLQTNGLQSAIAPFGAWALSPDGNKIAATSPWSGSLAIVDADPTSATFLQFTATPIPASSHSPGFTVNNYVAWNPDSSLVYIARQNQGSSPGDVACYDLASGWVDFDPSTPWIVDHIGAMSVPSVPLPIGLRSLAVSPDGGSLYIAGSVLNPGFAGRIDLQPQLSFTYATASTSLATSTRLAITPDGDIMALAVQGAVVLLDTATMAEIGSYALGSGINVGDLAWR